MHLGRVPSKQMAQVKQTRASQGSSETQVPGQVPTPSPIRDVTPVSPPVQWDLQVPQDVEH